MLRSREIGNSGDSISHNQTLRARQKKEKEAAEKRKRQQKKKG
jgi:hypothetical protein